MNCRQAQDFSMKYFDGDLNDIESAQLKQHFKVCQNCSEDFNNMSSVMEFLQYNEIEPPRDFEENVMEKIYSLEVIRKKRTDTVLTVLYGITGLLFILLAVIIAINFNGLTIFEAAEKLGDSMNAWSGVMFTLYNLFKVFYNMLTGITGVFLQVAIVLTKTYYYIFIALLFMLFVIQKMFATIMRQGDEV
ncbi:MAG: zf-HC2 domain-containing protein [Clostridia bacterium]|nr:zf-HC2 domain-containing protein [Clostridia bacterium]